MVLAMTFTWEHSAGEKKYEDLSVYPDNAPSCNHVGALIENKWHIGGTETEHCCRRKNYLDTL